MSTIMQVHTWTLKLHLGTFLARSCKYSSFKYMSSSKSFCPFGISIQVQVLQNPMEMHWSILMHFELLYDSLPLPSSKGSGRKEVLIGFFSNFLCVDRFKLNHEDFRHLWLEKLWNVFPPHAIVQRSLFVLYPNVQNTSRWKPGGKVISSDSELQGCAGKEWLLTIFAFFCQKDPKGPLFVLSKKRDYSQFSIRLGRLRALRHAGDSAKNLWQTGARGALPL